LIVVDDDDQARVLQLEVSRPRLFALLRQAKLSTHGDGGAESAKEGSTLPAAEPCQGSGAAVTTTAAAAAAASDACDTSDAVAAAGKPSSHGRDGHLYGDGAVVVQWDPERRCDPAAARGQAFTRKVPGERSIQIGLKKAQLAAADRDDDGAAGWYPHVLLDPGFVVHITDVTDRFAAAGRCLQGNLGGEGSVEHAAAGAQLSGGNSGGSSSGGSSSGGSSSGSDLAAAAAASLRLGDEAELEVPADLRKILRMGPKS
jgi:hypothetical protein